MITVRLRSDAETALLKMTYPFNSDVLITEADRKTARTAFPLVAFALDHAALREAFGTHDETANLSKSRSRKWGVAAVFLATFALLLSAASGLYADKGKLVISILGAVGALSGLASVAIGFLGVMYRSRKLRWLTDRLATERIRQFQFQHYAAHAAMIIGGARDPATAEAYVQVRARDFEAFRANVLVRLDPEFHALVDNVDPGDGVLCPPPRGQNRDSLDLGDEAVRQYFEAYESLRIRRQLDYCNLVLSEDRNIWKNAPVRQQKVFGAFGMICLGAVLAFDIVQFGGAIFYEPLLENDILQIAAIWAAFLALSVRTLEEGFQSDSEVSRMTQYRFGVSRAAARFAEADTAAQKFAAMDTLEKASFEELVLFLHSNHRARFVM